MNARLSQRLERPGLEPLWDELARRWEASDAPVTAVTLHDLDDRTRQALADLLGSDRLPPATCRIGVGRVAAALGTDADGLRDALIQVRGPLRNRAADRRARARARDDLWSWLESEAGMLNVVAWSSRLRTKGVPRGDTLAHRHRLETALAILGRLPVDDIPLAGLACDLIGDPHGLDHGTWLGAVVLDAIAERAGAPPPVTAEEERRLWASVGVVADGLSSAVSVLNLRPSGDDPVARFLRSCAEVSEPAAVTVSQLQRWPVRQPARLVHAFENPSMLAEAARRGWTGPPLVCTSGWPNVAAITLLRQLRGEGATVLYHGDFDPKGLAIAQMLADRVDVRPWRMTATDYQAHVTRARLRFQAEVPDVDWDSNLAPAMRAHGLAVYEEDMRGDLLAAVAAGGG